HRHRCQRLLSRSGRPEGTAASGTGNPGLGRGDQLHRPEIDCVQHVLCAQPCFSSVSPGAPGVPDSEPQLPAVEFVTVNLHAVPALQGVAPERLPDVAVPDLWHERLMHGEPEHDRASARDAQPQVIEPPVPAGEVAAVSAVPRLVRLELRRERGRLVDLVLAERHPPVRDDAEFVQAPERRPDVSAIVPVHQRGVIASTVRVDAELARVDLDLAVIDVRGAVVRYDAGGDEWSSDRTSDELVDQRLELVELDLVFIEVSDVVAEGFSPEVMRRWGFGYEEMKAINPTIIYVQQSGMGQRGTYGNYRATGPVAASLSGLSEMSGLPEPYLPAGIGYSYLDWFGAYNIATAIIAGLYWREKTGRGTYIDASQVECGISLTGSAILNYSANGTPWRRYGNRSPWKPAAPAGAYRCKGTDRWIAITCHTDDEWAGLCRVLGPSAEGWANDPRFVTLEDRLANQDELDRRVTEITRERDRYELMHRLQQAGVPAGVCQNAEDRFDADPQLKHLSWLTELPQTEMGTWPIKEFPVKLSETPAYMGGPTGRAAPCYGEDNDFAYGELLGLSTDEIGRLREEDVI
ncbi:MAG: CoA transferase, partial [Chloroflexi bacterium]|nr:CoA transferase [Chloroflexota bacterium]